ncbi:putative HTH-type transcriptional regulator YdfH [Variovorax sp. SRS16]|uniref:GntR family transcriptional regulator n=1 Tax=Variovorax sp. SRS16 TaxID=282217 RepID=UPI0013167B0D|nr:GntR family transcriptional regulator [Variovorax sp. SRS16]VTU18263.1 putative HTH-type transcriptional regulator YdfH [Variovorax sp. SRS16]
MAASPADSLKVDRSAKTLRELTLEKMRDAICNGRFKPGERLVERTLCEQLDVSRSIVREVLRHLETEGLVESGSQQGPVVATLTADQAAQIYEIRALLEGHAARTCAEKGSPAAIKRLVTLNAATQAAFRKGDLHEVMVRTTAFYEALFKEAGLAMAWEVVQSLNARINRLRALTISASGRRKEASAEMSRIVEALQKRDPQAAQEASQDHVRRVAQIAAERLREAGP